MKRPPPPGWVRALGLVLLVLLAYAPALTAGFVWDDDAVTANPLLGSWTGLARLWTPGAEGGTSAIPHEEHFWPLTYTSFWIEARLWGLRAPLLHATNVALHALAALLLWRLLRRLRAPGAWLAAALFAVHPVHAESVAWIIERKDVLSGSLYLAAFLAFVRYDRGDGARFLALSLAGFALALLAKSIAIGLPVVLALYLWHAHGRIGRGRLLALLPFALVAAALVGLDLAQVRAASTPLEVSLAPLARVRLAGSALAFYAGKALLPLGLAPVYPRGVVSTESWLPALAAAALLAALWLARGRIGRGPLALALAYAVTLGPVLGLVEFSYMRHSYVADRFQYLALAAPLVLVAAGLARGAARLDPRLARAGALLLLALLVLPTRRIAAAYESAETLGRFMVERDPGGWSGHAVLADELVGRGELDGAELHYRLASEARPDWAGAWIGLADVALKRDDPAAAARLLERAVEVEPDSFLAHRNLGLVRDRLGDTDGAERSLLRAIELRPDSAEARCDLGVVYAKAYRLELAIARFREALALDPEHARARLDLRTAERLLEEERR